MNSLNVDAFPAKGLTIQSGVEGSEAQSAKDKAGKTSTKVIKTIFNKFFLK